MADVNVTDLTQETYSTMDGSEQIIMFDSAEGKRATVAAVGEYVLKKLTTSLNGSNQTVAAALASLNSDCWNLKDVSTSIPSGANINDYTTVGRYKVQNSATAANITNGPTTADGYLLMIMELVNTSSLLYLAITNRPVPVIYFRRSAYSSGTWSFGEWQKITATAAS